MPKQRPTFCLAAEDESDARILRELCEHEFAAARPGLRPDDAAEWQGRTASPDWYSVKHAMRDAGQLRIGGRPVRLLPRGAGLAERKARCLALVFQHRAHDLPPPDALVAHFDEDRVDGWESDLRRGFAEAGMEFPIVLAVPMPETEAWYLLGFEPANRDERTSLAIERKRLSFSPANEPHRLTSTTRDPDRDCKQVLSRLTRNDRARLDACLAAAVDRVGASGDRSGLAAFLNEVQAQLVPLLPTP